MFLKHLVVTESKVAKKSCVCVCVCVRARERTRSVMKSGQLFAIPWTSPPGFSVYGISQARILEGVAIFSSKGFS